MFEQPQKELSAEPQVLTESEQAELARKQAKRAKYEKTGFIIMIVGFATLLIPNPYTGKYGEYTMFAGAMMFFSGRLIK
jgi:hypothetical protein